MVSVAQDIPCCVSSARVKQLEQYRGIMQGEEFAGPLPLSSHKVLEAEHQGMLGSDPG